MRIRVMVAAVLFLLVPAAAGAANDPALDRQWAIEAIGAQQAWGVGQGNGMVIAVVDTGVQLSHEDLAAKLVAGIDLVDRGSDPQDENGHGTHVAGVAAAATDNGRGIAGVAPGARIMPVRVLDDEGRGSTANVVEGVRWAVDNGADVVNLSLGQVAQQLTGPGFVEAVRYAWDKGVVVVVAAGNDFVLSSGFANEPALVVSATTPDDRKPDYSSGVGSAKWGMAAPGGGCQLVTCPREDDVLSTYWIAGKTDGYAYLSGTSMAAPHVAGAAAVLRSLGLTPQQTVDRLLATAVDIGASGRDSTFGAGRLDLAAATAGLGGSPAPAPTPPSPATTSPSPTATTQSPQPVSPSPTSTHAPAPGTSPAAPPAGPGPATTSPPTSGALDATPPSEDIGPAGLAGPSDEPEPSQSASSTEAASPLDAPDAGTPASPATGLIVLAAAVVAGTGGTWAFAARRRSNRPAA
jgi:subtilisin family serine protease